MNKTQTLPHGTVELAGKAAITKWTATNPVTKQLSLVNDGSIKKTSTAASLYEGRITRLDVSPKQFVTILKSVATNDCLSDLPPVDVPIESGSPGSRLLDGYLG